MPTSFGPEHVHRSSLGQAGARPGVRLRLSHDFRHGRLDGAWWPRSRNLETELADLVKHFPAGMGRILRAVCSRMDWEHAPPAVVVDGQPVSVGQLPQDGTHMVMLTLPSGNLALLVVPHDTAATCAAEVMRVASSPFNQASARDILTAALAGQRAPDPVPYRLGPASRQPAARPVLPLHADRAPVKTIDFHHDGADLTGDSASGRQWRISEVLTGWRLEFRDAGDTVSTNAGIHRTVEAAMAEANR